MSSTHRLVEPDEDGTGLTAVFAATMADLETRPETMAAAALRQGRPRRRRRVLVAAMAGTAAVALVSGLTAYGLTGLSATPATVDPAATTTAAPTAAPSAGAGLTPRVAALYLSRLAPSGTLSDFRGDEWHSDKKGEERLRSLTVKAQLDRGEGKVGLQISLDNFFLDSIGGTEADVATSYSCSSLGGVGVADCAVVRGADGSVLMTHTEALPVGATAGTYGRSVVADFLRADGTRVVVTTGNVPDVENGGTPRRGVTPAEAAAIARGAVWDLLRTPDPAEVAEAERVITPWRLGANDKPARSAEPSGADVPQPTAAPDPDAPLPGRVAALYLKRLAPSGTLTDYQGQEARDGVSVRAQLDRGQGGVGLGVGVHADFGGAEADAKAFLDDFYRCDRGTAIGEVYDSCAVVRNRDGSILMTYAAAPESVGSRSTKARVVFADYLRKDGTRVTVSSGNVSDLKYGGEVRRGVSLAQVRRIAVDPVWDLGREPSAADVAEADRVVKPWRLLPG